MKLYLYLLCVTLIQSSGIYFNCTFEQDTCNLLEATGNNGDDRWKRSKPDCVIYKHPCKDNTNPMIIEGHCFIIDNENHNAKPDLLFPLILGSWTLNISLFYACKGCNLTFITSEQRNGLNEGCSSSWTHKQLEIIHTYGDKIILQTNCDESTDSYAALDDISIVQLKKTVSLNRNINTDLHVSKKETNAYKRSKISAEDNRPSSQAIGSVLGIGVLLTVILLIVIPDISQFKSDIHHGATGKAKRKIRAPKGQICKCKLKQSPKQQYSM